MKKVIFIGLCSCFFSLVSCISRKVEKQEQKTEQNKTVSTALESVLETQTKDSISVYKENKELKHNAVLQLTPLVDSNGVAQTASYVEKQNGKTIREIYLTGGSLNQTTSQAEQQQKTDTIVVFAETADFKLRKDTVVTVQQVETIKTLERTSIGFQVGVYILGGLVLLLTVAMVWLSRQFKTIRNEVKEAFALF